MKVTFLGGAKTVTGSCYLLESGDEKLLVDCGMFQGGRELEELNRSPWPFDPADLSHVLLTHAHIDHSGLLPRLKREGFRGKIVCSKSTHELCKIMLPDSGHIQELEAEWKNRKRSRQRKKKVEPLYTHEDALAVLPRFVSIPYDEMIRLSQRVTIRLKDAGHILGSAIIEVWISEEGKQTKLVFSGDIGSTGQAIVRDPERIGEADYLFLESTYGNRLHPTTGERSQQLLQVIRDAQRDNGLVLIPSFAVGRTQELLYQLHDLFKNGLIRDIPVYVDSPLAIAATEVFQSNPEYFDEESARLFAEGDNPLSFPGLTFVRTAEESMRLNTLKGCAIIISGSGMADAGRIQHHLKHQLWKETTHVVFVGYQAEGSLGRKILSGMKRVKVLGHTVKVAAKIHDLSAFSAHADQRQLLEWAKGFAAPPKKVFLVHGEEEAAKALGRVLEQELNWSCHIPVRGESIEIASGDTLSISVSDEPKQLELSAAELQAYLQALERTAEGLSVVLHKYRLTDQQRLEVSERLLKLEEQLDELHDLM